MTSAAEFENKGLFSSASWRQVSQQLLFPEVLSGLWTCLATEEAVGRKYSPEEKGGIHYVPSLQVLGREINLSVLNCQR